MSEDRGTKRRRLDHNLYIAEGVAFLGAATFWVGFIIEGNSHTPGRILEATGFVIFGIGLVATAGVAYYLAQHFSRTFAHARDAFEKNPFDRPEPTGSQPEVDRSTAGDGEVHADRESDIAAGPRGQHLGSATPEKGLADD